MDAIEVEGSEAIEVVAQFDGTIVDVTHIVRDDDAESATRRTRWLLGGGLAALAVAAAAFLCAYGGARLSRTVDVVVAVCLAGGTWALLRVLDRDNWRGNLRQGSFARPSAYTIGPDPRASFAVAAAAVPVARFPLVRVDEAGDFVLDVAPGMTAARTSDGAPLEARAHKLAAGTRAWVKAGGATFFVANVPAPRRQAMARGIDWTREIYLGGVTLVVSAFLFVMYAVPPSPESLALDAVRSQHFARFVIVPPEVPPPPPMLGPSSDSAAAGHAARERAGTLGKIMATARTGQIKLPGPVSRDKVIAAAQQSVTNAGIVGILRDMQSGTQIGSLFARNNPLGDGADQILLGLQGTELQDGYGPGLDELGAERGGGGDGDRTIGSGPLGTVGFCRGAGCREGAKAYARSAPTGDLVHRARAPEIVPGVATVRCGLNASCLDKEIIRRVVRQHRNEVRHCYEVGLAVKPELEGRVVTSFTIATTGHVLGSAVTESSLRDRDVEACIAQAVRRWEFPSTQQMASVSYPFMLTPPR